MTVKPGLLLTDPANYQVSHTDVHCICCGAKHTSLFQIMTTRQGKNQNQTGLNNYFKPRKTLNHNMYMYYGDGGWGVGVTCDD